MELEAPPREARPDDEIAANVLRARTSFPDTRTITDLVAVETLRHFPHSDRRDLKERAIVGMDDCTTGQDVMEVSSVSSVSL